MMTTTLKKAALAACACAGLSAFADDTRPPVVKALEARGVTGLQEFKTGGDLRGFAGMARQKPFVVYVTRDGNAIVGARIDAQGEPIDGNAVDELVVKPGEEVAWKRLEATKWVRAGRADAPRVVYVFTDANCPWCHRFFDAAKPWIASGKVQLRLVFVGVIKADSAAKAAAILASPNPSEASDRNERDFDKGGIPPLKSIPADLARMLDANLALMDATGFRGTPGLVYRMPNGRVGKLGGYPQGDDLGEVLGPR